MTADMLREGAWYRVRYASGQCAIVQYQEALYRNHTDAIEFVDRVPMLDEDIAFVPDDPTEEMLDAVRALLMPGFSDTYENTRNTIRRSMEPSKAEALLDAWPEYAKEAEGHICKAARAEIIYRMMLAAYSLAANLTVR